MMGVTRYANPSFVWGPKHCRELSLLPLNRVFVAKHDILMADVTTCFTSLKKAVLELKKVGLVSDSLQLSIAGLCWGWKRVRLRVQLIRAGALAAFTKPFVVLTFALLVLG